MDARRVLQKDMPTVAMMDAMTVAWSELLPAATRGCQRASLKAPGKADLMGVMTAAR